MKLPVNGQLLSAEESEGLTVTHVSRETLALINQIRAEHRAKLKRPNRGIVVRKLTPEEIEELQACVERQRNPSLRVVPIVRRNVV